MSMTQQTEENREYLLHAWVLITLLVLCITNVCKGIESCEDKERFGPSCEYIDLRYRSKKVEVDGLREGSGKDCMNLGDHHRLVKVHVHETPISWIRILTIDKAATANVNLTYLLENSQHALCKNEKRSAWENILDVYCEPIKQKYRAIRVDVEGKIGSTCNIHISGGQDLCDDGEIQMSTHSPWHPPYQCVDKNTNTYCQTKPSDKKASWWIKFNNLVYVYSYRILNKFKDYTLKRRIKNARVEIINEDLKLIGGWRLIIMDKVEFNVKGLKSPVRYFKIKRNPRGALMLNFLEIEIYGESACSKSLKPYYGIACDKRCNCADEKEQCLLPTGGCPGGCKAGFIGIDCNTPCKPYSYGVNCVKKCSIECASVCNRVNGSCAPCHLGFHGPRCDKKCQRGTFGASCAYKCPNCQDQRCNRYTGICDSRTCMPGWLGEKCNMECEAGTWGQNCSNRCSANCAENTGCFSNGTCRSGCSPGFHPPTCFVGNVPKTLLNVTVWLCAALSICVIFELLYFCTIRHAKVKGGELIKATSNKTHLVRSSKSNKTLLDVGRRHSL